MKPLNERQGSVSCNAFLPNFRHTCSKIRLIKQGIWFEKQVFHYANKWSNSGPDNFGLINCGLNEQGLLYNHIVHWLTTCWKRILTMQKLLQLTENISVQWAARQRTMIFLCSHTLNLFCCNNNQFIMFCIQ